MKIEGPAVYYSFSVEWFFQQKHVVVELESYPQNVSMKWNVWNYPKITPSCLLGSLDAWLMTVYILSLHEETEEMTVLNPPYQKTHIEMDPEEV